MARHPDKLKKAQEEVDRVVGGDRLPTMADLVQLRYIDAMAKEVLRIDPVAPLAIAHRLTKDDEYRGYHLSAGTLVVPNTWYVFLRRRRLPNDGNEGLFCMIPSCSHLLKSSCQSAI
jgi:cytochrome P450